LKESGTGGVIASAAGDKVRANNIRNFFISVSTRRQHQEQNYHFLLPHEVTGSRTDIAVPECHVPTDIAAAISMIIVKHILL
ncbi:hypothetical protein, partial [Pantoea agglomerans]|uniref:hypothetical protein n=1 Tax=Enterobacter agglomerans TaxID=549 RepID=UPI003C7D41C3